MYFNKLKIDGQFCCMTRNFSQDFFSIICNNTGICEFYLGTDWFCHLLYIYSTKLLCFLVHRMQSALNMNYSETFALSRDFYGNAILLFMTSIVVSIKQSLILVKYFNEGDIKVITVSLYCSEQSTLPSVKEVRPWKSSTITMSSVDADWYISIT